MIDFLVFSWLRLFVFQFCCQDGVLLIWMLNSVLFGQYNFHRISNLTYEQRYSGVEWLVVFERKKISEFTSIVIKTNSIFLEYFFGKIIKVLFLL